MSLGAKDQSEQPLFYKTGFDAKDVKIELGKKNRITSEHTIADLMITGFIRSLLPNVGNVPLLIVGETIKFLNDRPHLPQMVRTMIPLRTIFNKSKAMDLKTPKFSNLTIFERCILRIYLQWRQNMASGADSPQCALNTVFLSGNGEHFGADGSWWIKQVIPYHPEIEELWLDNNDIDDSSLLQIVQALIVRHDPPSIRKLYPVKQLSTLDLSQNKFTQKYIDQLFGALLVYTPQLRVLNLAHNGISEVQAICDYLDKMDERPKNQRVLKVLNLRHNLIDWDKAQELNETVLSCHTSWNFKIELGKNPIVQPFTFDENEKKTMDYRINIFGA